MKIFYSGNESGNPCARPECVLRPEANIMLTFGHRQLVIGKKGKPVGRFKNLIRKRKRKK